MKTRLRDISIQNINTNLERKPYLKDYKDFTNGSEFKISNYLLCIKAPEIRTMFTKIRTNSSKLSPRPYISISAKCERCENLYNFEHILLECRENKTEREIFLQKVKPLFPNFNILSKKIQYSTIMSLDFKQGPVCKTQDLISIAISFVSRTFRRYVSKEQP